MMRSLRTRLIIGVIGAILLLLTVFGLIVYSVIRRTLINQFDESLASTAQMLAASVEVDGNNIELEVDVHQMPQFKNIDHPTYYQLWRHDGSVVARSASLAMNNLKIPEGPFGELHFQAVQIPTGRPGRAVGLKFTPRNSDSNRDSPQQKTGEKSLTLIVARDASSLFHQLDLLKWLLVVASGVTIALSIFIAAFVVRQGLNPLHSIASEIAAIREDDLAVRIETASVPVEILPIKNRLNNLLSRLEGAFQREKRFTADVAHELRTPLAGIRSTIEVTLTRARGTTEYRSVLSQCLEITENMQNMVNNLLMIARLDARQVTFHCQHIRLAELVNSCWQPFAEKANRRKIAFQNRLSKDITINADTENMSMVLWNLLNNAVEYTNTTGQIWVNAQHTDDTVELTVANTGCQLTNEQVPQVFDCFWRVDSSRQDAGVHCGLGLALVERIIKALGGSTSAEVQLGGIFAIRLTLPTHTDSDK